MPDYDLLRQVLVMNRLRATPITVPQVCWLDRGSDDARHAVLRDGAGGDGRAAPVNFRPYHAAGMYFDASPEQRATMWWGCVQAIADVHALDWRRVAAGQAADAGPRCTSRSGRSSNYYCDHTAVGDPRADPRAELAAAAEWLRDNIYEPEHLTLCWGDSRLSNVLYGPRFEVSAVVDWEIAYIGDHEADLAWLLDDRLGAVGVPGHTSAGGIAGPRRNHRALPSN